MISVFNFLLDFGVALLHPLVISVGMLLGIPISAGLFSQQVLQVSAVLVELAILRFWYLN